MILRGGPIVAILAVLSVVSVTLIAAKALQLRGVVAGEARRAEALAQWAGGQRDAARASLQSGTAPADRLLVRAMSGLASGTSPAQVEREMEWQGNAEMARMMRHIRSLDLIAMISPLLGLLGTVLGMIRAFRDLAEAEGAANAALLADGIWQALLTTAAGLIVAIPAAVAAALLTARVDRAGHEIEAACGALLAGEDPAPPRAAPTG